ncbi:UDP-3-O-(3-hydroxymyristoyl)glucosamine N-acyltransferase [Daejeonella sp. JGW-45]|uniref:UDP-3-O-(3-hydroxymyristoyl)glucosamine N-acyltransferase n=1 Tax=Daejeonella sp. JGW-45 TaxID=3034148 RepID=UPI0023ED108F|nr:UDP-3-O-(3-hydroxymyristoyl)glucosamine N-acyltransferase [Daejeonella sp. JGW-45]
MKDDKLSIDVIIKNSGFKCEVVNYNQELFVSCICATSPGDESGLTFIDKGRADKEHLLKQTRSKLVLCDKSLSNFETEKCLLIVEEPKLAFSLFANKFFNNDPKPSIHPSAVIHKDATIGKNVFIGPNCTIGNGTIGDNSILFGNVFIYDNVNIGSKVKIGAGTVIGAEGFGYNRDESGIPIQFPHVGGVTIEDEVEIGTNTSIDRGALSNTILRRGAKIDNLVHIAHNVEIGEYTFIVANSMIAGSTKIGNYSYVAPSASVKDQLIIGNKSFLGMAASLTKNISDKEVWAGNPAREINELKKLQKVLNSMLSEEKK